MFSESLKGVVTQKFSGGFAYSHRSLKYLDPPLAGTLSAGTVQAAKPEDWSTAPEHLLPMLENGRPSENSCINCNS